MNEPLMQQAAVLDPDSNEDVVNSTTYQNSLRIFKEKSEKIKKKAAVAAEAAAKASASSSSSKSSSLKKSFVADNGIRYMWDEEEDDWVEADNDGEIEEDDDVYSDEYDSDDGVKKPAQSAPSTSSSAAASSGGAESEAAKRKRKRKNKNKKAPPSNWVYITGLPPDVDEDELKDHFGKVGIIALNPADQSRKIKIYREQGSAQCKGDASICYVAQESVKMAIDILNEGYLRPNFKITVSRAEFNVPNKGTGTGAGEGANGRAGGAAEQPQKRQALTKAQIDVANNATKQALSWNEEDDSGVNKAKALKIVVLQGMFHPDDIYGSHGAGSTSRRKTNAMLNDDLENDDEDQGSGAGASALRDPSEEPTAEGEEFLKDLESDIVEECTEKCGIIDKITVFSRHPKGVVVVKFATAFAAEACIKLMDGRWYCKAKLRCFYWDGVTNYTMPSAAGISGAFLENRNNGTTNGSQSATVMPTGAASTVAAASVDDHDEKRLDEFGAWLEEQEEELPPEFQLRVAE